MGNSTSSLIIYVVLGALIGWIASMIKGRNAQISIGAHIIVGMIGALIFSYIAQLLGIGYDYSVTAIGLVIAVAGAVILINIAPLVLRQDAKNLPDQEIQSSIPPKIQQKVEKQSLPKASPTKSQSGIIFVSYRRTDSADVAGRIYDRLLEAFGKVSVFKDVDSIPLGLDFKEFLDERVGECNVLLAIIGKEWLEASDPRGRKRIEDPQDFVRIEIESALARGIPVIPLLVRGAFMPSEEELPASLKKLAYRNGIAIRSDPDFHRDMDRLISALKDYVQPKR